MDYDEQRLTALKKAYADMILNTAKEAAAKIVVSDRRALRFQHELNSTKQEALQMLLRLKQMMDSKVKEAGFAYMNQQRTIEELKAQLQGAENRITEVETACLSQQIKIEELEAQLGEAEDIVTDLREELRKERTERKSAGNSKLQLMVEQDTSIQGPPSQEKRLNTSPALVLSPELPVLCLQNTDTVPPPESQQNIDTVPPPALVLSPELPVLCQAADVKSSSPNPSVEIKPPNLPSIVLSNKVPEPYRNKRTQRIRAFEEKLMAGELSFSETTDSLTFGTNGREDGGRNGICKKSLEKRDPAQSRRRSSRSRSTLRSFRKKILESRKPPSLDVSIEEDSASKNVQSDGDPPRLLADMSEKGTLSECTEEAPETFGVETAWDKDKFSVEGQRTQSPDNSELPICKVDDEKTDVLKETPVLVSTSNGISDPPRSGRVIKYTFQRKRKRGTLSNSDGNTTLEQDILKKAVDKQNSPTVMEKCSILKESSGDSRRLAVVAHQLISLSEKKR